MLRFSKNSEQNHQIPVNRSESWIRDVFGNDAKSVYYYYYYYYYDFYPADR